MIIDQTSHALGGLIERAAVPLRFPQFRNAGTLAHLAHTSRGPRYVLVGGKAWYDPRDIYAWLESKKQFGPKREERAQRQYSEKSQSAGSIAKKRGRPTKLEQMRRRLSSMPGAIEQTVT